MRKGITKELLDSFAIPIGRQFVLYDVAGRKVYFFIRNRNDYRLKMIRGKRRFPITVKPDDICIRLNYNGTIERDLEKITELAVK